MTSVGERLRQERLRQGRDLNTIAAQTRISPKYLEAIEADDLSGLPGVFFYRSFLRQYASVLGLDENEFEAELEAFLAPADQIHGFPKELRAPIEVPPMPAPGRRRSPKQLPLSLIFLLIAVLGSSLLYSLWQRMRRPAETVAEVTHAVEVNPQPPSGQAQPPRESTPQPPQTPAAAAAPALAKAAPAQVPLPPQGSAPEVGQPAPPPPGAIGTLEIVATEQAWVSITAGNDVLLSRTLEPAQWRKLVLTAPSRMVVGNAGGIDVRWNGKSLGRLGPEGMVRVLEFTASGPSAVPVSPKPTPPGGPSPEVSPPAPPPPNE